VEEFLPLETLNAKEYHVAELENLEPIAVYG
jgi:hypothetical protein